MFSQALFTERACFMSLALVTDKVEKSVDMSLLLTFEVSIFAFSPALASEKNKDGLGSSTLDFRANACANSSTL